MLSMEVDMWWAQEKRWFGETCESVRYVLCEVSRANPLQHETPVFRAVFTVCFCFHVYYRKVVHVIFEYLTSSRARKLNLTRRAL